MAYPKFYQEIREHSDIMNTWEMFEDDIKDSQHDDAVSDGRPLHGSHRPPTLLADNRALVGQVPPYGRVLVPTGVAVGDWPLGCSVAYLKVAIFLVRTSTSDFPM